jgi:hypothetical protein
MFTDSYIPLTIDKHKNTDNILYISLHSNDNDIDISDYPMLKQFMDGLANQGRDVVLRVTD